MMTLPALPELSNSQLVLVAVAAVVVCWLAGQLVVLVRVLLNRETVDQDPQLVEVIERLDKLVDYAHDSYDVFEALEKQGDDIRDRDDQTAFHLADIATVLGHWHATAVLPVALDTVADRRTAREAVTAEQAAAKRATMNRGGQA
jgi:hypothetical protein